MQRQRRRVPLGYHTIMEDIINEMEDILDGYQDAQVVNEYDIQPYVRMAESMKEEDVV